MFLVGDPARAFRVVERFDRVEHVVRHREYVTLSGGRRGVPMSVIGTGIGDDNVEIGQQGGERNSKRDRSFLGKPFRSEWKWQRGVSQMSL